MSTPPDTINSPRPDRAPPIDPASMTPFQAEVAQRIAGSRGKVPGPFSALLHVPELADRIQALGAYLRYEGILDRDVAEWAILVVARHWKSAYVWGAHAPIALRDGVPLEAVAALEADDWTGDVAERLLTIRYFAIELMTDGRVSDSTFDTSRSLLGLEGSIELSALVGYYCMISLSLNALGWD